MAGDHLLPPNPSLSDGRVTLRPWTPSDVPQLVEACQDPEIQRYIPIPLPYDRAVAEGYVARTEREWADGSKAAFAIVEPEDTTRLLGAINVAISGGVGNSGYWVAPGARRRGVAVRALRLLTDWAFATVGLGLVLLEIRPENEASRKVASAAGFREAGRLEVTVQTAKLGALLYVRMVSDLDDP